MGSKLVNELLQNSFYKFDYDSINELAINTGSQAQPAPSFIAPEGEPDVSFVSKGEKRGSESDADPSCSSYRVKKYKSSKNPIFDLNDSWDDTEDCSDASMVAMMNDLDTDDQTTK